MQRGRASLVTNITVVVLITTSNALPCASFGLQVICKEKGQIWASALQVSVKWDLINKHVHRDFFCFFFEKHSVGLLHKEGYGLD